MNSDSEDEEYLSEEESSIYSDENSEENEENNDALTTQTINDSNNVFNKIINPYNKTDRDYYEKSLNIYNMKKKELMEKNEIENVYQKEKDILDNYFLNLNLNERINIIYEYFIISFDEDFEYFNTNIRTVIDKSLIILNYFVRTYVLMKEVNDKMKELKKSTIFMLALKSENYHAKNEIYFILQYEMYELLDPLYQNMVGNNIYMMTTDINLNFLSNEYLLKILNQYNNKNENILFYYLNNKIHLYDFFKLLNRVFKQNQDNITENFPLNLNKVNNDGDSLIMLLAKKSTKFSHRRDCIQMLEIIKKYNYPIKLNQINIFGETLLSIALKKEMYHLLSHITNMKNINLNMNDLKNENSITSIFKGRKIYVNYIRIFDNILKNSEEDVLINEDNIDFYCKISTKGHLSSRSIFYLLKKEIIQKNLFNILKNLFKNHDFELFLHLVEKNQKILEYVDDNEETLLSSIIKIPGKNNIYYRRYDINNVVLNVLKTQCQVYLKLTEYENINFNHIDKDGNNIFMNVCKNNKNVLFEYLLIRNDINFYLKNKKNQDALYLNSLNLCSSNSPHEDIIFNYLINDNRYNLNYVDENNNTILMNVIHIPNLVYLCLKNRFNLINHINNFGYNALLLCKNFYVNNNFENYIYDYSKNEGDIIENRIKYINDILNKYNNKTIVNNKINYENISVNILLNETKKLNIIVKNQDQNKTILENILSYSRAITFNEESSKYLLKLFFEKIDEQNMFNEYMENLIEYELKNKSNMYILKRIIDRFDSDIFERVFIIYNKIFKRVIKKKNLWDYQDMLSLIYEYVWKIEFMTIIFKYFNYDQMNYIFKSFGKIKNKKTSMKIKDKDNFIKSNMKKLLYEKNIRLYESFNLPADLINQLNDYILENSYY